MKTTKYFIFAIILLFLSMGKVYADNIYKIDMDIYLDKEGNANITETWDVKADDGTEWYKQLYNLGNEEISDFKVSMDGKSLTQKEWDIDESLSEKAGYYGINYVDEGLELCFGKTDMKRHTFVLNYNLSNFIINTNDSQILYQTLIPSISVDNFTVKVRSFYEFPDNLDVWGYGYRGYAYVKDGIIEMSNEEGERLKDDYVVLLVKFPIETFNTHNDATGYESFDDVYNMAEEGSYKYNYNKKSFKDVISEVLAMISSVVVPMVFVVLAVIGAKNSSDYGTKRLKFSKDAKKLKDVQYFREIPVKKDIFKGYWFACQYGLVKNKTDFLGAILLKWLKHDNIQNVTVTTKILKKEERAVKLISKNGLNELECQLYDMMEKAAEDGVLESNEFKNWCKKHYNQILKWFNKVIDNVTDTYISEGLITPEKKTFSTVYNVSDKMKNDAMQVAGLKKFLNEFSNIKDRESIEVKLWDEYLMFAQIFGIADKVAKEFKKLYPDVITDDVYNDVIFIHHISYTGVSAATTARRAAESYSAGGGGFSSGGGGFGSFGGGGSAGGR